MTLSSCTALNGVHVLVVDDNPDSLALTTVVLTNVGAVVTAADSVATAQTHFLAHPPQLVVSDLAMPGVDGYDFIAWVRTLSPADGGQVLALARPQDCLQALQAGFNAYLRQPVDPDRFLAVVTSWFLPTAVTAF